MMKLASLFYSSLTQQSLPDNALRFEAADNRLDEPDGTPPVPSSNSPSPLVLVPGPRVNSLTAPDFERELMDRIDEGATDILLDFSAVTYISSVGLRVILKAGKRLKNSGGSLGLCGLNPDCSEVFRISGFDSLFPIYASVEETPGALARVDMVGCTFDDKKPDVPRL